MDVRITGKTYSNCGGEHYLSAYLLSNENDETTNSMKVDGSSSPVDFTLTAPADYQYLLFRSFPYVSDGVAAFEDAKFGALNELSNGVKAIFKQTDGSEHIMETWKTNAHMKDTFYDFEQSFKGAGSRIGRWTFEKDLGSPLILNTGEKFIIRISDNLTGLDAFTMKVKGRKIPL